MMKLLKILICIAGITLLLTFIAAFLFLAVDFFHIDTENIELEQPIFVSMDKNAYDDGVELFFDGKPYTKTYVAEIRGHYSYASIESIEGLHTIEIRRDGYKPGIANFEAFNGNPETRATYINVSCDDEKHEMKIDANSISSSSLEITVDESCDDIELFLNGNKFWRTLDAGSDNDFIINASGYRIEVRKNGYTSGKIRHGDIDPAKTSYTKLRVSCNEDTKSLSIDIAEKDEPEESEEN